MENALLEIHGRFISLPETEVKRNKRILEHVVSIFVEKLKGQDPLFKKMFRRVFYGGSFYDGLRVGKPEEFDLDLLLVLPEKTRPVVTESSIPGFVHVRLTKFEEWLVEPEAKKPEYKDFQKKLLTKEHCLSTDKVKRWAEGIFQKSINEFAGQILTINGETFEINKKFSKSGPAFTLQILGSEVKMDIDFVPCFVFSNDKWPRGNYRSNPYPNSWPEFFVVPKNPTKFIDELQILSVEHFWRLSFQEQERELIKGKERLKSTVKLLKKMRDTLQHKSIESYYIKTIFLHLQDQKNLSFWNLPLHEIFMTCLKKYREYIDDENIPYYWNLQNNLIGEIDNSITLQNIRGRLDGVIKDIKNNPKAQTLAKYLLTSEEYERYTNGNGGIEMEPETASNEQSRCTII